MKIPSKPVSLVIGISTFLFLRTLSAEPPSPPSSEWEKAVAEFTAAGESLDFKSIVPPPIPDDQNYAALPFLRGITIPDGFDHPSKVDGTTVRSALRDACSIAESGTHWEETGELLTLNTGPEAATPTDLGPWAKAVAKFAGIPLEKPATGESANSAHGKTILKALDTKLAGLFAQSDLGVKRPSARWTPPPSEFYNHEKPSETKFLHGSPTMSFATALRLRAIAAIHAGETKTAADSIVGILRLSEAESPYTNGLLQFLVSTTVKAIAISAIWEGLRERAFDDPTLARLQSEIAKFDLVEEVASAFRSEAIFLGKLTPEGLATGFALFGLDGKTVPKNWADQLRAYLLLSYLHAVLIPIADQEFALLKSRLEARIAKGEKIESEIDPETFPPMEVIGAKMVSASEKMVIQGFYRESAFRQIQAACALERHFLKHGTYPVNLETLVPNFLKAVPEDPIDRKPLRYRQTDDGRYLLYSIGWDQKDENGIRTSGETGFGNRSKGDWPWSYSDPK